MMSGVPWPNKVTRGAFYRFVRAQDGGRASGGDRLTAPGHRTPNALTASLPP